ncbi:MAG: nucleoside triphosphate pyrophosphohydrolase [Negativicutes bacterium]
MANVLLEVMAMELQNKLVRDRIPELIKNCGRTCITKIVSDRAERQTLLRTKLLEEFEEYCEEPSLEELADIAEVVLALTAELGYDQANLFAAADKKRAERGGFSVGVVLVSTE